jgi:hypothetical protein
MLLSESRGHGRLHSHMCRDSLFVTNQSNMYNKASHSHKLQLLQPSSLLAAVESRSEVPSVINSNW